ncbi:MAG TPA: CocE/NonD family hydrolase [Acidimicrobiales bacterium]|nr:CocE/NonD family hydrolase [Acidimicrobiales bacterium]
MRLRGRAEYLAVALLASLLSPVLWSAPPAAAATGCNTTADSSTSDYYPNPSPWSGANAPRVRIRVIAPTSAQSGATCVKPPSGWPLVIYLHGWNGNRCESLPFYTRAETASHGYVVLSFNARGKPSSGGAGLSGCDQTTDAIDGLDDDGTDIGGSRDKKDITELINWVRDSFNAAPPTGCGNASNPCADTNNVGVTGFSYGGFRTWLMGVPSPTNPDADSRIKAIAPSGAWLFWDNIEALNGDGAGAARARATNSTPLWWANQGWVGHTTEVIAQHNAEIERGKYLNQSISTTATDFWKARYLVDDNATVDQAGDIQMPVFVHQGWLDGNGGIFNQVAIAAYNKVPTTNKYLYLGSCSHTPDPCHTYDTGTGSNRSRQRDALRRFFDKHLSGSSTPVGGPVFYTVPPKYTSSSSNPWTPTNQTWQEQMASSWPPATGTSTTTYHFRNAGTLTPTAESGTTCTPGTPPAKGTGCSTLKNNLNAPLFYDFCVGTQYGLPYGTYASDEVQAYDLTFTSDTKVVKVEADLRMKTDTTRIQVYVDLWDVSSTGTELKRIWQGNAQVAPIKRDAVANSATPYRFTFVPGGVAWTMANGHKLRVKVTAKYAQAFAGEPLPATYTLFHNADHPSNVKLTTVS